MRLLGVVVDIFNFNISLIPLGFQLLSIYSYDNSFIVVNIIEFPSSTLMPNREYIISPNNIYKFQKLIQAKEQGKRHQYSIKSYGNSRESQRTRHRINPTRR